MRSSRCFGVLLVTALAVCGGGAPAASASQPEFQPPGNQLVDFTSGVSRIERGGRAAVCQLDTGSAVVDTSGMADIRFNYTRCRLVVGGKECPVHSVGAATEEIATNTLKGELGTVAASEATSGVGILLSPESGTTIATLAATECEAESKVTGNLAGEVSPIHKKELTGTLAFKVSSEKQIIKKITVLGKAEEPSLKWGGEAAALESTESLHFAKELEVT